MQHGRTIVAYDSVGTSTTSEKSYEYNSENLCHGNIKVSKTFLLESLHFCIDDILKSLDVVAMIGINMHNKDRHQLRAHSVLLSYVAESRKSEDFLEIRRRNKTRYRCYRCLLHKTELNRNRITQRRTL